MSDTTDSRDIASWIRALLFVTIAGFMIYGPFHQQVIGHDFRLFRPWRMFGNTGVDLIEVEFFQYAPDGAVTEINYREVLGFEVKEETPPEIWGIESDEQFMDITRQLCETFGSDADIRAVTQQATRQGFDPLLDGSENLCNGSAISEGGSA